MTATTAVQANAYRLTGITTEAGTCDRCARELRQRVFTVTHTITGETLTLGRRCAAKATGYAPSAVERQAAIAARIAEVDRREAIVTAAFPTLAESARSGGYNSLAYQLLGTATTEDGWWGGRSRCVGTWQEYLTHHWGG